MTKSIRQEILINAKPRQVFDALMDQKKHARFTGAPAVIGTKVGGPFSCYGGYITGVTLDLVSAKRIVQAWRGKDWSAGTFSIVTFALAKAPGGKTKLTFTQIGVPAGDYKAKSSGWRTHYWKPLKAFLEN